MRAARCLISVFVESFNLLAYTSLKFHITVHKKKIKLKEKKNRKEYDKVQSKKFK